MDFFSELLLTKRFKPFSTAVAGTYRISLPFKMRVIIIASAGGGGWGHQPSTTNSHSGAGMGGSGAGFRGELVLPRGTISVVVGAAGAGTGGAGTEGGSTIITFADGSSISLGGGKGGSGWKSGGAGGAGGTASTTRMDCPAGSLINGTASATGRSYCAGVTLIGQPSVLSDGSQTDENVGYAGGSGKIYMDYRYTSVQVPVAAGYFSISRV